MQKYNGQLIRQFASSVSGNAASGVTVTVRRKSDNALATLYVDNNTAGAALTNPVTTSATGHFAFYAADGVYTLTFSDGTPQQVVQLQDTVALQEQFDNAMLNAGYIPSGTFAAGATLTQANQVLSDGSSYWRWDGSFPKTVAAGSAPTPVGVGAWFNVGDMNLRQELSQGKAAAGLYVTPEMFGVVGASSNDNALFLSAAATGKPIKAFGSTYNLNQLVFTTSVDLEFGENTVINNVQASGTKQPAVRAAGTGLTGAAVSVTALGSSYLFNSVTVSSAAGFAVGDTIMLKENQPLEMETNVSSPVSEDFNYYEFATIKTIASNVITFEEFIGGEFQLARSIIMQKCVFLQNANIRGGIFSGGNSAGGGVGLEWCRKSKISAKCTGLGDSLASNQRMGGAAGKMENCWECEMTIQYSQWALFSGFASNIQSCKIDVLGGKRTSNGGLIIGNARQCEINPSVQDNPGDVSGDGLGVSGRSWGNTFGAMTISGANCYALWVRQPVKNNTFQSIVSMSGITAVINLYGDKNNFMLVKSRGHQSPLVALEGNDNTLNIDYEGAGSGVVIRGGKSGNIIRGKSNCIGSASEYDVLMSGAGIVNHIIDLKCGSRGLGYGAFVTENHTNRIRIRGSNPYSLGYNETGKGYTWSRMIYGVGSTAQKLKVVGTSADTDGLKDLVVPPQDDADVYLITLKMSSVLADTYSQYLLTGRQSGWDLTVIKQGSSTFAPKLTVNGTKVDLTLNGASGPNPVAMVMEKF